MDQRQWVEKLDAHAERLKQGGASADLAVPTGPAEPGSLDELLQIAQRLAATLVPVEPRPAFRAALKARLVASARPAPAQPRLLWVLAGAGGLLYLFSLAVLSLRAALLGRTLMYGIISGRANRGVLPKGQAAP